MFRRGILTIAAVIDMAINARSRPVSAKALAARHKLPPRHLEPVLQALVRGRILRGVRGPKGGYELAREHQRLTAEDASEPPLPGSALINNVVKPARAEAERVFSATLRRINVEDMAQRTEALK